MKITKGLRITDREDSRSRGWVLDNSNIKRLKKRKQGRRLRKKSQLDMNTFKRVWNPESHMDKVH